jgi:micrococcal nuclease
MYEYSARAIAVVDGDTLDIEINLGLDILHRTRIRLLGIDTPELHSPVPEQREAAKAARDFVINQVMGKPLTIRTVKDRREKYGRYLAGIWIEGDAVSVNDKLIEAGLAVPYSGGLRE